MNFITLILFILSSIGITNLVVNSAIFDRIRDGIIKVSKRVNSPFGEMVEYLFGCMMCSGFWIGMIMSLFFPVNFIIGALVVSLTSHCYSLLISVTQDISSVVERLEAGEFEE
jgi:hypothetical protein